MILVGRSTKKPGNCLPGSETAMTLISILVFGDDRANRGAEMIGQAAHHAVRGELMTNREARRAERLANPKVKVKKPKAVAAPAAKPKKEKKSAG